MKTAFITYNILQNKNKDIKTHQVTEMIIYKQQQTDNRYNYKKRRRAYSR